MKATDLMIGDFVKHINGNICLVSKVEQGKGFACRIGNSEYLWDYNNKYDPIPLTKEILKANRFVDGVLPYTLFNSKLMLSITDRNGFWIFSIYAKEAEICDLMVAYVHELQHVLRVCGLNELADNFKVKAKEE